MIKLLALFIVGFWPGSWLSNASPVKVTASKNILSDPELLKSVGVPIVMSDARVGVALASVTEAQERQIAQRAHEWGRCGGYEVLPEGMSLSNLKVESLFGGLHKRAVIDQKFEKQKISVLMTVKPEIEKALAQVSEQNLKTWVQWFSAYPTRFNRGNTANDHVVALKQKLEEMVKGAGFAVSVNLVTHKNTPQKSLHVQIPGAVRPTEHVVLGGHMDSINQEWFGGGGKAPGADDNASGSSNLLEALRILLQQKQPERTVDFFWYAGEESGLLGSAEIAADWKRQKQDVIAVLQLDMTMFPGDGAFVLSSMTDFTSAWLRSYLKEVNTTYLKAKIVEDKCGYGCSDHASWNRQGYPTLMPSEATFDNMNSLLHTERDVIDGRMNFAHSAMFTKIALVMAMDLGNSTQREP